MAAAAVAGTALAYHLLSRPAPPSAPPVVVLGGEVETADGRIARSAQPRQPAAHDAVEAATADAAAAAATPPAGHADAGPRRPGAGDRGHRAKDPYSARLSRYQGRIRGCFNQHATSVAGTPQVALALRIDHAGSVVHAGLVPPSLEGTDLGTCVLAVARGVSFGAQEQEVERDHPAQGPAPSLSGRGAPPVRVSASRPGAGRFGVRAWGGGTRPRRRSRRAVGSPGWRSGAGDPAAGAGRAPTRSSPRWSRR